ncbi:MAG: hypothetical protein ACTSO3_16855 [Candidatus Heimdallarchaeaceae archaeon]
MNLDNALEEIFTQDSRFFEDVISKTDSEVRNILIKSDYPKTGKALFMFFTKCSFLKNAIYNVCREDDHYSASILYRSYLEHFLRHHYLLYRFMETRTDQPGIDYYKYCMTEEGIRFLYGVKKSNQIFTENFSEYDVWKEIDDLLQQKEEYRSITKTELQKKTAQFEYKNILKYLNDLSEKSRFSEVEFMRWLVADYAELSSFVHGGPWAEDDLYKYSENTIREKRLVSQCRKTFNLYCIVAHGTFFCARLIDNQYPDYSQIIKSYLI